MEFPKYDTNVAGSKTHWIIEFHPEKGLVRSTRGKAMPHVNFLTPFPPNTKERKANLWLGSMQLEEEKKKTKESLRLIQDLCDTIAGDYKNKLDSTKKIKEKDEWVKKNIRTLTDIVKRFNKLLKKFKKDDVND